MNRSFLRIHIDYLLSTIVLSKSEVIKYNVSYISQVRSLVTIQMSDSFVRVCNVRTYLRTTRNRLYDIYIFFFLQNFICLGCCWSIPLGITRVLLKIDRFEGNNRLDTEGNEEDRSFSLDV